MSWPASRCSRPGLCARAPGHRRAACERGLVRAGLGRLGACRAARAQPRHRGRALRHAAAAPPLTRVRTARPVRGRRRRRPRARARPRPVPRPELLEQLHRQRLPAPRGPVDRARPRDRGADRVPRRRHRRGHPRGAATRGRFRGGHPGGLRRCPAARACGASRRPRFRGAVRAAGRRGDAALDDTRPDGVHRLAHPRGGRAARRRARRGAAAGDAARGAGEEPRRPRRGGRLSGRRAVHRRRRPPGSRARAPIAP